MSEEELVHLLLQDDNQGYTYLYTHVSLICRKPMSDIRVPEDSFKEIFHESVTILYEKIQGGKYEHRSKVSTYLCQICKYKAIKEARRLKKEKGRYKPDYFYPLTEDGENQDIPEEMQDTSLWKDKSSALPSEEEIAEAIQHLGDRCKEIIVAFYYHCKSIRELTLQFEHDTENAAKQAKHKCVQRLKDKFLR